MKITPNTPKNGSGLTQLITMGESIRQIWVNMSNLKLFLYTDSPVGEVLPLNIYFER